MTLLTVWPVGKTKNEGKERNMKNILTCKGAAVFVAVAVILATITDFVTKDPRIQCLMFSTSVLLGALALIICVIVGIRDWRKNRSSARGCGDLMLCPAILWPFTAITAISLVTACPASEVKAQSADIPFKLMTNVESECTLTPVNGGQTITMSRESIKVDMENNLLITPIGIYKINRADSGEITLQSADGIELIIVQFPTSLSSHVFSKDFKLCCVFFLTAVKTDCDVLGLKSRDINIQVILRVIRRGKK